ncbi:MAG: pilus assembly protein PilM [Deltaproteobacteria bacterium]|nr:pilus assembly protein PilM [Deltaproteobacteria bacterium]
MARLICGIDVGTGAVRAAVLKLGLRSSEVLQLHEVPLRLPEDGGPAEPEAVVEALRELARRLPPQVESRSAGLPGGDTTFRLLSFPRAALRQAEAAIRVELEGQLPFEADEALLDQLVLSPPAEDPATVLVALARTETVRARLRLLAEAGLEPGLLAIGALPLARLVPPGHALLQDEGLCLLDVGRTETDLLLLRRGRPVFLRSFRAGSEDVTRALAKALRRPRGEAEAVKCTHLALPEPGFPAPDAARAALAEAAQSGLGTLLTPLRRTLLELRAKGGAVAPPTRLLLAGGGSRIPGLASFLTQRLGLPVERLADAVPTPPGAPAESIPSFAQAIGLALEPGAPRSRRLDLRKGDVRYRGDRMAIRGHLRNALVVAGVAFLAWLFSAWAESRSLDREASQQSAALERATLEVMGKKYSDFGLVRSLLGKTGAEVEGPLPALDALDVLAELARTMPSDIRNNITLLTIETGKLAINGLTRNAEEASRIPEVLKEFERCVRDVGTLSGSGSEGNYSYQIEAATSCP